MAGQILRFLVWAVVIVFILDFVYSAMNQGRHLHQAFKPHRKKRRK
jgi:hypothetical protein